MRAALTGEVAVVSPHLDDAVLSLGASIARAARGGAAVRVITVLAGDPRSTAPAGLFDASCGFATAGEAARARRAEDAEACRRVGATPVWLPFWDGQYEQMAGDEQILQAVASAATGAERVLIPGYPLTNPDHAWLARLLLEDGGLRRKAGLYVEQPYAAALLLGRETRPAAAAATALGGILRTPAARRARTPASPDGVRVEGPWLRLAARPADWLAKHRAIGAYASQLPMIGRLLRARIAVWELGWRGEAIAWLRADAG